MMNMMLCNVLSLVDSTWAGHVLKMEESDPARKSLVLNQEEIEIGEANQSWGDAMLEVIFSTSQTYITFNKHVIYWLSKFSR
jgi:hypothetical protein